MKNILTLACLLVSISSFGQQITYEQFQQQARTDINLQPEYGHVVKDKDHLEEDQKFIDLVLKQDTTHRKGSEHLVGLGFKYLGQGDMETAMRRFNQAWLLDPQNENVYWGFGAIYGTFSDYPNAIVQYDKGLALNTQSSVLLTDKATIYFVMYQRGHQQSNLDSALSLLTKSYGIDAQNLNTIYKLSICYFLSKDCANAQKFYSEFIKVGGTTHADGYADALKKQCNN